MKEETKKQVRIAIVGLFGALALICATSEPINQDTWFKDFFISKTIAALFYQQDDCRPFRVYRIQACEVLGIKRAIA